MMFYEEIRTKQSLPYISFCSLRNLYNSELILLATSLGTNAVVVTRDHCMMGLADMLYESVVFVSFLMPAQKFKPSTVEPQWLERTWDHENLFEI